MSFLHRIGNKRKILPELLQCFPRDISMFIDVFMGSGTISLAMVNRCKYVIANDKDDDIFNLFLVVKERKDELCEALIRMPQHYSLLQYWRKHTENDPVFKAVRFLLLSNFCSYGKQETLQFGALNTKDNILSNIERYFEKISRIQFMSCDFRNILNNILKIQDDKNCFLYSDPPYLDTTNNYQHGFTEQDAADLFTMNVKSGRRFAISEFAHPIILCLAKQHNLIVTTLKNVKTIGKRNNEILITNYEPRIVTQKSMFEL